MSSYYCEQCGTEIIDGPRGYTTECPHWPLERITVKPLDTWHWEAPETLPPGEPDEELP